MVLSDVFSNKNNNKKSDVKGCFKKSGRLPPSPRGWESCSFFVLCGPWLFLLLSPLPADSWGEGRGKVPVPLFTAEDRSGLKRKRWKETGVFPNPNRKSDFKREGNQETGGGGMKKPVKVHCVPLRAPHRGGEIIPGNRR